MNILLTKKLPQEILDLIKSWGWDYEIVEALKINSIEVKELPAKAEAWIISSRNSFDVVKKFIANAPPHVYCVGGWMKGEIERLSANIKMKSFENMKSLAADLAKQNLQDVVYFCGVEHRQELEEGLKNTSSRISKVITHQSEMIFPVIKKSFDAVFVFSPRSVESLLKNCQFSKQTVFACIGSTTSDFLHSRGIANTFAPSYPDAKILIEEFHLTTTKNNLNLKL
jgi:uroporphyrinogen-III synthase